MTCQRGTGAATRFEYAFKAAEPSRGFVLKVYNGGLEDTTYELVSSSTIALNGPQVLGPSAFNQNVAYTEEPVTLQADNTLAVEVRGKPGGAMIVKIHPFVVIDAPAEGQVVGSGSIAVSGHLNSAAVAVSVNGVPAVISGDRFTASGVPWSQGDNMLMATARHAGGSAVCSSYERA